jgi:hypothetical protein
MGVLMEIVQGRISTRSLGLSRAPHWAAYPGSYEWQVMIILLDREGVSAYHRYGLSYTVADCSWQGSEQDSWAGLGSAGLYLIHCSVPRYDDSCMCICLLTGLGSHRWWDCCPNWWDTLHCRTAEVAPERLQVTGGFMAVHIPLGIALLKMVKLSDVWEELPDTYIYIHCQESLPLWHGIVPRPVTSIRSPSLLTRATISVSPFPIVTQELWIIYAQVSVFCIADF